MRNRADYIINISHNSLEQMYRTIKHSNVEEGGKLIGAINKSYGCTEITVQSYIDSGIKADKSSTHLFPDWDYQEKTFRLLELFDNNIKHIGTWHTHHCNGLKTLSSGDISSYFSDVNNPNYLQEFFLAILVTDIQNNKLNTRYYLFKKGEDSFIEIGEENIHRINTTNNITEILQLTNKLSNPIISDYSQTDNYFTNAKLTTVSTLKEVRILDDKWLRNNFSNLLTKRNRFTNVISWEWRYKLNRNEIKFKYFHPPFLRKNYPTACLKVFINRVRVKKENIPINSIRHSKIENIVSSYIYN